MPTYEYECKKCGHSFEAFQAMSDEPLTECPECGKELRRLIFGGIGVIFKGPGFYINDKGAGKAPSMSTTKEQRESPSSDSKPAESGKTPNAAVSGNSGEQGKSKPSAQSA